MKPLLSLLLLVATLCGWPAWGVVMTPFSIEELRERSDLILHGTVTNKVCARDEAGNIVTRAQLIVAEVLKGKLATNVFTLIYSGGTIGNVREESSIQIAYENGEEVVAFLRLNQRGEGVTLGLVQGKFHVWKDPQTGEALANNLFHGAPETSTAPSAQARTANATAPPRLTLIELRQRAKGGGQ